MFSVYITLLLCVVGNGLRWRSSTSLFLSIKNFFQIFVLRFSTIWWYLLAKMYKMTCLAPWIILWIWNQIILILLDDYEIWKLLHEKIVSFVVFLVKDEYQLIRDCISGHIYDSSPVDFSSDLGSQLAHLPGLVSWITKAIASGLDAFFSNKFEAQRTEYWQTLYSSAVCFLF